jgi:hypothetical protein
LAGKEETDIEFGIVAGGGTASDQTATGSEAFEAVIPCSGTNVFDDNIDAAIVGEATHLLGDGHDEVVDDFVSAEFAGLGKFFVGAGGGDDAGTEELGDLNGGAAYTASGSENQDRFAGLKLGAVDEHVPRGEENERDGGGVRPIEAFGIRETVDLGHANILRAATIDHVTEVGEVAAAVILAGDAGGTFATSNAGGENYLLADVDGGDFRADLGNFAGNVATGNVGERDGDAREAAANPEVEMIESAGANAHEDLIVAENRFGNIGIAKDGRVTVFVDDNGFHRQPPGSVGVNDRNIYIVTRYVWRLPGPSLADCSKTTVALLRWGRGGGDREIQQSTFSSRASARSAARPQKINKSDIPVTFMPCRPS